MQKSESSTSSESSNSLSAPDGATSIPPENKNKQPVEFIFHQPESPAAELSRIKRLQHRIAETKARLRKFKQDVMPGAMDIVSDMAQRESHRTIFVVPVDFGGDNDNSNDWVDGGDADADGNGMSPKMALLAFLAFLVETDWTWVMDLLD
ncbi:hypothetical protein EXIGLDRAFT_761094 [Exidia glandulosa HHB12029]|uniref:Uncharacterized protein n=1 Tax=Exidia glandulosa HHB12029 TaxID=1314781 RepID=A0A165NQP3_EXIGL|nr:hypothetical protein EXIGLDRAFT_761094 [Exidia glandulosa HHB12029]